MGLFFHYPYPQTHGFLKPALKSTFLINMSHNIINWICSNWNKFHVTNFRLKLVITCSFYTSLLMYWLSFTWWIIFYVDVSGYGKPVGYPKHAWVWVWAKFYTPNGYEFFSGRIFSSCVRVWASNTQRDFTHCHLYADTSRFHLLLFLFPQRFFINSSHIFHYNYKILFSHLFIIQHYFFTTNK
jgi:hypothetical protein